MRSHPTWLWLLAAACAAPAACTFGADDFKLVSSTDGASAGTGASSSGGKSNNLGGEPSSAGGATMNGEAGLPNVGGTIANAGAPGDVAGAGGDTGKPPQLTCSNHNAVATLFSAADLLGGSGNARVLDVFHLIPATATSAYAIAVSSVDNGGTGPHDSLIAVRRLSDSMSNAVGPLTTVITQGLFRWAGAYATAQEVHVIGTDERGIIDVKLGVTANGQIVAGETVTPLMTPDDCLNLGTLAGGVRDVHTSYDGTLTYAVTCATQDDMMHSMYVFTPAGTLDPIPDTGPEIGKIVRQFVTSKDGTMLLATGDDFGPHVDMRYGRTGKDLAKAHAFTVQNDPTLGRSTLLLPQADDSGVFLSAFLIHFDGSNAPMPPLTLMGGTFRILDYPKLSDIPPAPLSQTAVYNSTSDNVIVPADGAVRPSGDVLMVGDNPLKTDTISAWLLDADGQLRSNVLTVHSAVQDVLTDNPSGALVGVGMAVAWRQIEADAVTTNVMIRSVSCL